MFHQEQITTPSEPATPQNEAPALEAEVEIAPSEEGVTPAESAEVTTEPAEGEKPATESTEEGVEDKITRIAQGIAAKSTLTIEKQRNDAVKRVTELEAQLSDKTWDRHLSSLFNEDVPNIGEEEANVKKSDREKIQGDVKAYKDGAAKVQATLNRIGEPSAETLGALLDALKNAETGKVPTLAEAINLLDFNLRDWKVREEVWPLLFPEEKAKMKQFQDILTRFNKAPNMDVYEQIMLGVKETIKGKQTPFVPDSSQSTGGSASDKTIMDNYQKDPKNPANIKAYEAMRLKRGIAS